MSILDNLATVISYITESVHNHPLKAILGTVLFLVYGIPYLQHGYYLLQFYFFNKFKDTKSTVTYFTHPLGLIELVKLVWSLRNDELPIYFQNSMKSSLDQHIYTGRRQVIGGFAFWTVDPENIKAVLATQFKDFCLGQRHSQFRPLLGDGIFTLDGNGWHHSRSILRPQFSREQISRIDSLEVHVQKMITKVDQASKAGEFIDIQQLFFQLTIDTATEFLFGESVDLLSGGNPKIPEAKLFGESFTRAQEALTTRSLLQDYYYLYSTPEFKKDCQICKSFTSSFVNLALERNPPGEEIKRDSYIFLDELTKETRDPILLRDQALNILLAGRDTTASLLSFAMRELSQHPEVYKKLRSEILTAFGTSRKDITFESLKRCTYLRHVLNETLRLYPTVPNNFRFATRDTTLPRGGGPDMQSPVFVPKGSMIFYTVYAMHRNPNFWGADSEVFNPDRWYSYSSKTHHAWDFLPFNGGPRICLGQQFALTEMSFTLVRLLQKFEHLECKPGLFEGKMNHKVHARLTMCVAGKDGVSVRMT